MRWEFSLCRIYVISGSFRAFDRRPLDREGAESRVHRIQNKFGGGHTHQTAKVDGSCSSEITHFGGFHNAQLPETGDSSGTNWNVNNNDQDILLEEPSWELEWEQFNWL